jgi:hypothetical protein
MRRHGWVTPLLLALLASGLAWAANPAFALDGWQPVQTLPPAPTPGDMGPTVQGSLGMAADGTVTTAWVRSYNDGRRDVLDVSNRPPNGEWSAPEEVARPVLGSDVALNVAPDGAASIAWSDEEDGHVYMARRPAGGEFGPAQDLTPEVASGARQAAVVTIAPTGATVVAWRNRLPGAGMHDQIDAMVIPPDGPPGPVQVLDALVASDAPYSGESLEISRLVKDGQGNVYAEWRRHYEDLQDSRNSQDSVELATLRSGATAFSPPIALGTAGDGVTLQEAFMAGNAAGDLIATWKRVPVSGNATIEGRYRRAGQPFPGSLFEIPQPDGRDAGRAFPTVTGDGHAAVAWGSGWHAQGGDTIWVTDVSPEGDVRAPSVLGTGVNPTLAASTTGEMIAGWSGPNIDLYYNQVYASVRPAGAWFGPATPLSGVLPAPSSPRLVIAPSGDALAVWLAPPDYSSSRYQWSSEYVAPRPPNPAGQSDSSPASPPTQQTAHISPPAAVTSFAITARGFRYHLAEAGVVTIKLSRKTHGRYRLVSTLTRRAAAGLGEVPITPRLRRRIATPGTYRATLTWTGDDGTRSSAPSVRFHRR